MSDHNPALVPEEPKAVERTYKVTGHAQETLGHQHGETSTAKLDPAQEAALIAGGAIEIVGAEPEDRTDPALDHDAEPGDPPLPAVDSDPPGDDVPAQESETSSRASKKSSTPSPKE
jgi:hypothetical protein